MATLNLGAIRYNWKGAYNNSTAYVVNDVVSANGNSYICIQAGTGQAVGNATAYWNIMSSAGTNGTNGTDLTSTLTTQGDLLYRNGSGLQRLGAGTSGQVLQTGGSGANPSWTDASGGLLLARYVTYDYTLRTTTSTSYTSAGGGLSTTVTPASTASKFHLLLTARMGNNQDSRRSFYTFFRGSDNLATSGSVITTTEAVSCQPTELPGCMQAFFHPNSTSSQTFTVQFHGNTGSDQVYFGNATLFITEYAS
jgi:hypothetical protein